MADSSDDFYSPDPLMMEESYRRAGLLRSVKTGVTTTSLTTNSTFDEYYSLWRGIWDPADSRACLGKI